MPRFEIESDELPPVAELEDMHERHRDSVQFTETLVTAASANQAQIAATWLLGKRIQEAGAASPATSSKIAEMFPRLQSWQARLHILQIVRFLDLAAIPVSEFREAILPHATDSGKMVRAWALDALYHLAIAGHPDAEADMARIRRASGDSSAAVRARIRNLLR